MQLIYIAAIACITIADWCFRRHLQQAREHARQDALQWRITARTLAAQLRAERDTRLN